MQDLPSKSTHQWSEVSLCARGRLRHMHAGAGFSELDHRKAPTGLSGNQAHKISDQCPPIAQARAQDTQRASSSVSTLCGLVNLDATANVGQR